MTEPVLQVENISISFSADGNTTNAVKDISFLVEPAQTVAIVGESGSGKSVTALSIMQLLPKQSTLSGNILFAGKNLAQLSPKEINTIRGKDIGMIFQEPMTSLNPVFTCGYQVMEAIQLHQQLSAKEAKKKTIELFEKVKLPDPAAIIDRYPHQLSGGQKQRVMIAMAISCNPSLLIADEPTTALDVTVQKTILDLIKELQQQNGMSVIIITHDLGLVADVADKIIVMHKGQIVEQANAKNILTDPQHPYTKALLACRPGLHPKGERLPLISDFLETDPSSLKQQKEHAAINTTSNEIVLKVEHVKVYYPGKRTLFGKTPEPFKAVDDVSFTVSKGEIVGLVGESGCGKTTLGRAILHLQQVTSGSILLQEKNLSHLPKTALRNLRKDVQIVFQDPYGSLNPRLTIGEAILEPMTVHSLLANNKQRKEKVIELLEKVDLDAGFYDRYPHQFSGGQRQRICIARALALNPSFLVFDESVSALDVSVQAQVLNLINDLKQEFQFTGIFISHDLAVVRYISNRILVMNRGKIIEEGDADQVYFSPKMDYTKKLIDSILGKNIV
ncbi:ABC transporter ATP-binding protein [Ferruginibacter lapsinanis]|uniref:ABC transporter ATP-binding protein n=1 Tax=Ferruginibacter lapsinanis TaxID=563172 RepID=UPI001E32D8D3|nr:ABC transporter ATP-binding protein [Ferruginibacter lapsinanis]UEG50224.1 ABC transporter ATP-binding protein [Ferruginibacter lapsinanis]